MVSICTGGKILTVLLVLPSINASASIAFRWAVGFAFYAMERHHDPRTEAVGARRCRLGRRAVATPRGGAIELHVIVICPNAVSVR